MLEGQRIQPDTRLAALMREFNALDRTSLEAAIDAMIARLDAADGDPDVEPNGDELDVSASFDRSDPLYRADADEHRAWGLASEDSEDGDEDCCQAGDDRIVGGPIWQPCRMPYYTASDDDMERSEPPAWGMNQTANLFVTAANDWPELRA